MTRVRLYLVGSVALVVLAGCGRSFWDFAQREPWRHEAEVACMKSGAVKEGPGLVRVQPIDGPGVCGADLPLKVAALGATGAIGYAEELRPPGAVPGGRRPRQEPPWPVERRAPISQAPMAPVSPALPASMLSPSPMSSAPPVTAPEPGAPLSIHPPGRADAEADELERAMKTPFGVPIRPELAPRSLQQQAEELRQPPTVRSYPSRTGRMAPLGPPASIVPLGPSRAPVTNAIGPVELKPAATLACPIVSALDQWIAKAVQPAALRWFGQPVVAIRQISAYSCRGMNGNPHARISEHAFGNALDIAAFVLADGHKITVKNGWRGTPEEQGFLRDVQGAACETFTTVLAPGSNRYHYDHMHVDLMRRRSGRTICNPNAVDGELVAARARNGKYAKRGEPTITGSITSYAGKSDEAPLDDEGWIEHDGPRESVD